VKRSPISSRLTRPTDTTAELDTRDGYVTNNEPDDGSRRLRTFYSDPQILMSRQNLTQTSHAATDFADWTLALAGPYAGLDVLDAGAGVGRFVTRLLQLAPGSVVALDLFYSMLETIRSAVGAPPRLALLNGDIERLPFRKDSFDVVFANHVLYHLRDIPVGLDALIGVLKRSGRFVATTNANDVFVPVVRLHEEVLKRVGGESTIEASLFSLENGAEVLGTKFARVETHVFTSASHFASIQTLIDAYATTGRYRLLAENLGPDSVLEEASDIAAEWFDGHPEGIWGEVRMGAFVCGAPK
jgi:ubiquinone/menaquinone biosynthesis C-methylase UbiE